MPLKRTAVVPNNPEPVRVISVPVEPLAGVKVFSFNWTMNEVELRVSPFAFVTLIKPVMAPGGTTALIEVGDRTL